MTTIVSVSLSSALLGELDAEAKRQRRSRSFIVSESIREYVARRDRDAFTAARDRTLQEGLALAPAERVAAAEELWQDLTRGRAPAKPWTAAFDTFAEYDEWRRRTGGRSA